MRCRPAESALYVADVATGALTPVAIPDSHISAATFAPDGVGFYLIADAQSDFEQLLYYNPITRLTRRVSADVPWDVEEFAVGAGGHYVAYVVNDDGQSRLTVLDTLRNLEFKPPGLDDGRIDSIGFDDSGQKLAFSYESARSPSDVYVYDVAAGALQRWTASEIGPLDPANLAAAQLVHYPTWDRSGLSRRTLSAYVYLPRGPSPCPVLIDLPERRGAAFTVPPRLEAVHPIRGQRSRLRRDRAQRARLIGLRQGVPRARRRQAAR